MKKIYIILGSILFVWISFISIQSIHKSSVLLGTLPTVSSGDTITSTGWNNMIEKINNTEATSTKVGSIYNTASTSDYLLVADGVGWNATNSMTIDNTGFVGIGTTTPAVNMVVNRASASSTLGIISDSSSFGGELKMEAPNGNCYRLGCTGLDSSGCTWATTTCPR